MHYYVPDDAEKVAKQIIWRNSNIKVAKKTICYDNWITCNIIFIKDILNEQGLLADKEQIERKYNMTIPQMEFNSLISSIPSKWKKLLKEGLNCFDHVIFWDIKIKIFEQLKKLAEISTKDFYRSRIDKLAKRPTSEAKWEEKAGLKYDDHNWENIYLNPYSVTKESRLISFHFKITHRIVACGYNLKIWNIENTNICNDCNEHEDCIEHHLVACEHTKSFWDSVLKWWSTSMKVNMPIDTYDILFGLENENQDNTINQLNFIFLHGTYYVYTCKRKKKTLDTYNFLIDCKNKIILEQQIAIKNEQEGKFEKKWGTLMEIL